LFMLPHLQQEHHASIASISTPAGRLEVVAERAAVLVTTEQHGAVLPLLEAAIAPLSLIATHSRIPSPGATLSKPSGSREREGSQARAGRGSASVAGQSVLAAEVSVTLQCDVFNMEKMGWEPVLDPWTVSVAWALAPQYEAGASEPSCSPPCQHLMVRAGQVMDLTATSSLFLALAQAEKLASRLRLERAAFIVSRHADAATAAAMAGASADASGVLADTDVFPSTTLPVWQPHAGPAYSLAAPMDARDHGAFGSAIITAKSIAGPSTAVAHGQGTASHLLAALDTRRSTGLLHLNLKGAPGHVPGPLRPSASYGSLKLGSHRHPSPEPHAEERDSNTGQAKQGSRQGVPQVDLPAAAYWFYNDLGVPLEVCVSDR
jgi:hypothetical protein